MHLARKVRLRQGRDIHHTCLVVILLVVAFCGLLLILFLFVLHVFGKFFCFAFLVLVFCFVFCLFLLEGDCPAFFFFFFLSFFFLTNITNYRT